MATSKYSSTISEGDSFGSWTVAGSSFTDDAGRAKIAVVCSCGTTQVAEVYNLVKGRSSKCRKCSSGMSNSIRSYTPTILSETFSRQANTCALTGASIDINNTVAVKLNNDLESGPDNVVLVSSNVKKRMGDLDAQSFITMCQTVINNVPEPKPNMSVKDFFNKREQQ